MPDNKGPALGRRAVMEAALGAGALGTGLAAGFGAGGGRSAQAAAHTRFVTANNNPYDILDPHQVFDIGRIAIRLNMYDALVRWVDNPPVLKMWLVEKPEISADGLQYTVSGAQRPFFRRAG